MSLNASFRENISAFDPLDIVESNLNSANWPNEREVDSLACVVPTRWGDMGGMFAWRTEPDAVHFSVTLDVKPQAARRYKIQDLIMMANERLDIGHIDYWADDEVIVFRHALPLMGRDEPSDGEVRAVMMAAIEAIDRFLPAFNFVIWAGKSPKEALEAAMFETKGEA